MKKKSIIAILVAVTVALTGCGQNSDVNSSSLDEKIESSNVIDNKAENIISGDIESLDISEMFSEEDMDSSYDESKCVVIDLSSQKQEVKIKEAGCYILKGTLTDGNVTVDATKNDKIRLVLDNATIQSKDSAAIYVKKAGKVFITLAKDSKNTLIATGESVEDGKTNIDACLFAKSDITLNGDGQLTIETKYGNGVTSKDNLVIVSGKYDIIAKKNGLEGKDSVRIAGGNIEIDSGNDGIHSGNDDDNTVGYTYIEGGNIEIDTQDDGIHADTQVAINGGNVNIVKSKEGIEGLTIEIGAGNISIVSSDDGMNATDGNGDKIEVLENGFFEKNDFTKQQDQENRPQPPEGAQAPDMENRPQPPEGAQAPDMENRPQPPEGSQAPDMENRPQLPEGSQRPDMEFEPQNKEPESASDNVYIKITGGIVDIKSAGDGVDSNGALYVTGGELYVTSTANTNNGALDYDSKGIVSGGIVIAAGYNRMPQNFTSESSQGAIMVNTSEMKAEGSRITLYDSEGRELINYLAKHEFNNIVVSCPGIELNGIYKLTCDDESWDITMDNIIYGESNDMGPMGNISSDKGEKNHKNKDDKKKNKNN